MKGTNAKKAAKKAKVAGKSKGNNATKRNRRSHLHSDNHSWNVQRKLRTKGKRMQSGPPGTGQGKHMPKNENCDCGGCHAKKMEDTLGS